MNKENLQKQIEEMKTKLADMEAELNKPEVIINYWQPKTAENLYYVNYLGHVAEANYTEIYQRDKTRYRVFKTKEEAVQARDNYITQNKLPHKLSGLTKN